MPNLISKLDDYPEYIGGYCGVHLAAITEYIGGLSGVQ